MVDRLKRVLVESLIGAIALGYVLAQAILELVRVFTSPFLALEIRNLYVGLARDPTSFSGSPLRAAVPPGIGCVLLLLVWYVLLRWLYFTPLKSEESVPHPEQTA
jgi:hypothetical protein